MARKYRDFTAKNHEEREFLLEIRQYTYNTETETKTYIRRKNIALESSLIFLEWFFDEAGMPSLDEAAKDSRNIEAIETCYEIETMPFGVDYLTIHHIVEDYSTEELEHLIEKMLDMWVNGVN
jgi:hypothetical protein